MTAPGWTYLPPHDPRPLDDGPTSTPRGAGTGRRRPIGRRQLAAVTAQLCDRDRLVLRSLGALHHLTTRQIERLHFQEDTAVTPLAATRRAHRCVTRLHALGLLDRLDRRIGGPHAGSAPTCWHLSAAGARALDTPRRRPTPGIQHLAHTLDVAEVVVRLHEHARRHPLEIVAIETEPDCWRRLTAGTGRRGWLKPDLRVTLTTPGHELHWFVEVDRGHERTPALTHKIGRYLAAWKNGSEQARAGVFPRVLWIVPDPRRAAAVDQLCTATTAAPAGLFAVATRATAIDTLTEPPQ
jgi:hypothetical protein